MIKISNSFTYFNPSIDFDGFLFVSLLDPPICITNQLLYRMGRNKIYLTEQERTSIKRQRAQKYYWANKEDQDAKARLRYQKSKQ